MTDQQQQRDSLSTRLERIEDKVDRLAESLITVARVEERIATILSNQVETNKRLGRHSNRLDDVETGLAKTQGIGRVAERLFWVAATAAIAVYMGATA